MLTRRLFLATAAATPFLATRAAAAEPAIFAEGGIAIRGADPVAYLTEGAPVIGSSDHALMWQGAEWRFADAANRATFEADPEAFMPQYGGYCAYAASQGYVATSVPEAWTVHEGKLYLNFSTGVRRRWLRDIEGHIAAADANWPGILQA